MQIERMFEQYLRLPAFPLNACRNSSMTQASHIIIFYCTPAVLLVLLCIMLLVYGRERLCFVVF